jgi:hypothetical protein
MSQIDVRLSRIALTYSMVYDLLYTLFLHVHGTSKIPKPLWRPTYQKFDQVQVYKDVLECKAAHLTQKSQKLSGA